MANYFINPAYIKETAYVDENVDDKFIEGAIVIAHDLYVLPLIGTGLYNEIASQIGAGTLTALNTTLRGYLAPALRYWTLYELAEPMTYKFTNKNIMKKKSENSEPVTFAELTALKDKFKNIAEWHAERTRLYLVENESSYPLYLNPGTGADIIHPKRDTYTCSWFLGCTNDNVPDWIKAEYPATYGS